MNTPSSNYIQPKSYKHRKYDSTNNIATIAEKENELIISKVQTEEMK